MSTLEEATALRFELRNRGYSPIPCEGKRPAPKAWEQKLDVNADEIRLWEKSYHLAANTGILTRFAPAIDIDVLDPAAANALEALAREHFEERGNILVRFGRPPKRAILLRTDVPFPKISRNIIAADGSAHKIEILCDGQQIIAFGVHPETEKLYAWFGGDPSSTTIGELPYCNQEQAEKFADDAVKLLIDEHGFKAAGDRPRTRKRREGNGKSFVFESGAEDWTYLLNNIHEGRELHDSLRDLAAKLITSGMSAGAAVNHLRALMEGAPGPHDERWQQRYEDIPRLVTGAESLREEAREESDDDADNIKPDAGWSFHGEEDPAPTAWLIKYILPETGAALISGQWGTYKTTVALDIAVSIMTGTPFAGRYMVKRPGGIAYLALEGVGGLASRLTAAARARGLGGALPFVYRSDCPALTRRTALDKLVTMVEHAAKEIRERFDVPTVLIVIDTVVIAAGYSKSGDDNDASVAQHVMGVLSGLSQRTGALVIGIDHFGKVTETGTRGSSAKEGHADAVLALLADRELAGNITNTRLTMRKVREGVAGLEIPFTPKTVEVGTDPDGDPITRVIIEWNAPAPQPTEKGWSKSLQLLRRILMTLLVDGQNVQPFLDGPIVRACNLEAVRAEFHQQYPAEGDAGKKAEARKKAFQRVLRGAQDNAVIMIREISGTQFVWLAKSETGP